MNPNETIMHPYKTIAHIGSGEIVIQKSRFIGACAPVSSEEQALRFIQTVRADHKDASHHCFAYVIGQNAGIARYSDDGEPHGTAGMPIMHVATSNGVADLVIVVTRYFGGVLLGAGGLVRAYTQGAVLALDAGKICSMVPTHTYLLTIEYTKWDKIQHIIKSLPMETVQIDYTAEVVLTFKVRESDMPLVLESIANASDGKADPLLLQKGFHAWE